jgi:alpha-N-arabinofuranosidase
VDQGSPEASDAGAGTADRPFLTIGRAAALAAAGERILVRAGIYREEVRPASGGAGPQEMVTYEAEPGHKVVIRGSCVLPSAWEPSSKQASPSHLRVWSLRLPEPYFSDYNPFGRLNLDTSGPDNWQSINPVPRSAADTRRRGLLFQDGVRMKQVSSHKELLRESSGYWVEKDGWTIHLRTLDGVDPNDVTIEATNRKQAFAPLEPGVSYLRLKGFVIEHIGNGFSYPVEAAVSPMGGHHWIIEDNLIRQVNSDAISIGSHLWFWGGDRDSRAGHDCVVRGNTMADCGVSGIKGLTPANAVISGNVFDHVGWQGVELGYDNGALKLLVCSNVLVRGNLIRRMVAAPGIWLDWDDDNCRVTENTVLDSHCPGGAVFLEASDKANWVDHNVIWNIDGNGVYLQDADGVTIFDNLIGCCTDAAVHGRVATKRKLNGRRVTCRRNRVYSNVFVENHAMVFFTDADNSSDHNIVLNSANASALRDAQRTHGRDLSSLQLQTPGLSPRPNGS